MLKCSEDEVVKTFRPVHQGDSVDVVDILTRDDTVGRQ